MFNKMVIPTGGGASKELTSVYNYYCPSPSGTDVTIPESDVVIFSVTHASNATYGNSIIVRKGESKTASYTSGSMSVSLNDAGTSVTFSATTFSGYFGTIACFTES